MTSLKDALLNFQYQYSKLFILGFNRKRFEIISSPEKMFAVNNSKNTFIALLFTLFASGHIFSGPVVAFTSNKQLEVDFYVVFSFLFLIGLISFRQFLWLINGRQEMAIENGHLILSKKGTFWTKPKTYSFDNVSNIRQLHNFTNTSLYDKIQQNIGLNKKVIFSHNIGQIYFDYNKKTVKVFCDLEKEERVELIQAMNRQRQFTPLM